MERKFIMSEKYENYSVYCKEPFDNKTVQTELNEKELREKIAEKGLTRNGVFEPEIIKYIYNDKEFEMPRDMFSEFVKTAPVETLLRIVIRDTSYNDNYDFVDTYSFEEKIPQSITQIIQQNDNCSKEYQRYELCEDNFKSEVLYTINCCYKSYKNVSVKYNSKEIMDCEKLIKEIKDINDLCNLEIYCYEFHPEFGESECRVKYKKPEQERAKIITKRETYNATTKELIAKNTNEEFCLRKNAKEKVCEKLVEDRMYGYCDYGDNGAEYSAKELKNEINKSDTSLLIAQIIIYTETNEERNEYIIEKIETEDID